MSRTDTRLDAGPLLALLLLFAAVIRFVPAAARPALPPDNCERLTPTADAAALDRCATLHPDDVELMMQLGSRLEADGQSARAEETYRRALRVDPRDGEVHLRLAHLLLARKDLAGAREEALAALAVQPQNSAAIALARQAGASE